MPVHQIAGFAVCAAAIALVMRRLRPESSAILVIAAGVLTLLMILPQIQAIRDVLDGDGVVVTAKENAFPAVYSKLTALPDLVVCDSQAVKIMIETTPSQVPQTTFSILMARMKGDLNILAAGCAAAVVAGGFVLRHFGDPQPFKDSTTTVLSIVAQALMALAFMEQWALWIITNIVSVIMWVICVARGEAHAAVMVIMWSFYLLNSINGLRVWIKLSRPDAD